MFYNSQNMAIYLLLREKCSTIELSKDAVHGVDAPNGSMLKGLAHMNSLTKVCARCKIPLALDEFYIRNGKPHSYCKSCISLTAREHPPLSRTKPKEKSEVVAIEYLKSYGIPALPGKALRYMHVDVVVFGCIRVEVKTANQTTVNNRTVFRFTMSATQSERGLLCDLVLLVCNRDSGKTFHLFPVDFPAFYIDGRLKTGFTYTDGAAYAGKFGNTRVVMTQPMMDDAKDKVSLIYDGLNEYIRNIKTAA